jgi:hypothetical protein
LSRVDLLFFFKFILDFCFPCAYTEIIPAAGDIEMENEVLVTVDGDSVELQPLDNLELKANTKLSLKLNHLGGPNFAIKWKHYYDIFVDIISKLGCEDKEFKLQGAWERYDSWSNWFEAYKVNTAYTFSHSPVIVFTSKFVQLCPNDETFVAVLGHEIGHQLLGHTREGNPCSRELRKKEYEADMVGTYVSWLCGFSGKGDIQYFEGLRMYEGDHIGEEHPRPTNRINHLKRLASPEKLLRGPNHLFEKELTQIVKYGEVTDFVLS